MTVPATYAYQWKSTKAGVVTLVGTNAATYALATTDVGATITCTVTGTNTAGSTGVITPATPVVIPASGGGGGGIGTNPPPTGGNVTVDFRTVTQVVDPLGVGIVLSEFNGSGAGSWIKNSSWLQSLKNLAPGSCRFAIRWAGGSPGAGAGGGQATGDAATWCEAATSMGAIPFCSVAGDNTVNGSSDNTVTTTGAAGIVSFFNANGGQNGGPIRYWGVGNEPDNPGGPGVGAYESALPGIMSAMRGAASVPIKISAPAAASWNPGSGLIQNAASAGADTLSYHAYNGAQFPDQSSYYANVKTMQGYASGVGTGCEECNSYWTYSTANAYESSYFYDWHNTCFIASAAGQTIAAGGHFFCYSDSNGALGLMNDGSNQENMPGSLGTTFPAYWGIGIWTGMNGQFKRWSANMVSATSTIAATSMDVFACDNGKIVLINKTGGAQVVTIDMGGKTSGTYIVSSTNAGSPLSAITTSGANNYSGSVINYTVPASTCVSIDVT